MPIRQPCPSRRSNQAKSHSCAFTEGLIENRPSGNQREAVDKDKRNRPNNVFTHLSKDSICETCRMTKTMRARCETSASDAQIWSVLREDNESASLRHCGAGPLFLRWRLQDNESAKLSNKKRERWRYEKELAPVHVSLWKTLTNLHRQFAGVHSCLRRVKLE